MSDEECPKYKDGDIVWVKLGPCWWPGEVTENGPEDFTAKKPPLAIVKFFNESTYEFVKSYNNIYLYNCERKNEFIKKGMDSFRANNSHMEKFPGDVSLAEIRTDGNPNILSDPIFAPQKKSNVIAEVFGSPSPKKTPKDGARHSRGRSSTSKNSSKKTPKVNITHRRFLGCDDYEAHIRIQYPGKDASHSSSDDEITRLNSEPTQNINCSSCPFQTTRLEVMLFHVQCHIKGIASPVQVKKKKQQRSPKKKKSRIFKHITSDDDRTNSSAGFLDTDSEEEVKPKQKRKRKTQGGPKKPKQKKTEEEKPVTDIRTNLLAEWSDSEDNDEEESSKLDTSGEIAETGTLEESSVKENKDAKCEEQKEANKSCFDFDEEEEDTSLVQTAVGRKIPRVIPPTDKRKSTDPDNEDASLPVAEDDENRMEILKVSDSSLGESQKSGENEPDLGKEETEFKDLMESTSVPELPEVPDTIKPVQNFSPAPSVRTPDKEVATKLTNPKKRFVKSFEDFELLLNEQRKAQEEKEEEMRKDKGKCTPVDPVEVSESKFDDGESKEEQNDEVSSVDEVEAVVVEKVPEIVTENEETVNEITKEKEPEKKVIIESVIDEKTPEMIEETKVPELKEPVTAETTEEKIDDKPIENIEATKEVIEDEQTIEPVKKIDSDVQISKLKCQIMSKLSDEDVDTSKSSLKSKTAHRTPRSKILESYRNDKYNEQKRRKSTEVKDVQAEESVVNSNKKERLAPKKSKYLKFNQEESSESVEKIEEEPTREETSKEVMKEVEAIAEKSNPDEEIGKINQIDEYFNDFLFNFDKKQESPKVEEEFKIIEEKKEEKPSNEVVIKCAANDEENDGNVDISIKTNLTNFNKNEEEMSALSTLAMVSQLETNFEKSEEKKEEEIPAPVPEVVPEIEKKKFEEHFVKKPDSELVTIDGNLTVVSEKDLADGQVEITANASPTYKKPVTLTSFSMDFSECNSNSDSVSSEQSESKVEEIKPKEIPPSKSSTCDDLYDIEEHIPSQIVDKTKPNVDKSPPHTSKLLERLTTDTKTRDGSSPKVSKVPTKESNKPTTKTKFVLKSSANKLVKSALSTSSSSTSSQSKPIILSEKIIKPAESSGSVSVQRITSKRNLQDPDEIDTFIIQKGTKTVEEEEELELTVASEEVPTKKFKKTSASESKKSQIVSSTPTSSALKKRGGKAKILQQTIITPAGEIIQPTVTQATTVPDDNVFDINSMPIVLSDQILTPESIENMPIFISDTVQSTGEIVATATVSTASPKVQTQTIVKKTIQTSSSNQGQVRLLNKSIASPTTLLTTTTEKTQKLVKSSKILSSVGSKLIKHNSLSTPSKHSKYVIVSQSPSTTQNKYTVGKRQTLIKRTSTGELAAISSPGTLTKVQNVSPEPSGNKIMILTNQQGHQQRVLLTPAQQKLMGYQNQGGKIATKAVMKGNLIQKSKDGQITPVAGSSGILSKRINSNQTLITSSGQVLTPIHPHQQKTIRIEKSVPAQRKLQIQSQKVSIKPQQKTILIKNQHGQTVRKIQGTDDALLDQQVAEQIEAIKASGVLQQKQEILNYKQGVSTTPKNFRRSYAKKVESTPKQMVVTKAAQKMEAAVPPLAPISPKKPEQHLQTTTEKVVTTSQQQQETKTQQQQQERPLNQLVIQDAMGNQTTITEGQILALPSETVDGQPQSYMLVTLDESGNLTPLNNEALLSLDPNLGLGGDLGNTVLQIDQSALKDETETTPVTSQSVEATPDPKQETVAVVQPEATEKPEEAEQVQEATPTVTQEQLEESSAGALQTANCNVSAETGQQLIVTGDPIAAQKFLESLTEGSTDLANILASAEGSSILIHADGQQILINTDSDNQMLLSVNTDNLNMAESTEGGGNPIFATQPSKNQDILAAALADTDVFQQEQNGGSGSQSGSGNGGKSLQSQLSPNSALYPMNVGNVLETSLTLNSPIMTPLEVPSTNSKKISDENDILNQVPKNVDLPITITDPNISQTVSQQQVASMMVTELQSNLELTLPISESITVPSSEMNSPSFVYSLPTLDGTDMGQKAFNSSMPLLTEDETTTSETSKEEKTVEEKETETISGEHQEGDKVMVEDEKSSDEKMASSEGSFLDESEGLCTLGGEMCSSLSEPPPDMFDLSAVLSSHQIKTTKEVVEGEKEEESSGSTANQETETSSPTTMNEDSCEIPVQPEIVTTLKEDDDDDGSKKCKFD